VKALGISTIISIKRGWHLQHNGHLNEMVFDTDWSVFDENQRLKYFQQAVQYLEASNIKKASKHMFPDP